MPSTVRNPNGTGALRTHWFKFGVGATGAVTAATLKQGGDGLVRSVTRAAAGRYTITLNPPNVQDVINCRVTVAKAAQTDAVVLGSYKVASLTAGSPGVPQTFEIFFCNTSAAAADVPSGAEVHVQFVEPTDRVMGRRVDN